MQHWNPKPPLDSQTPHWHLMEPFTWWIQPLAKGAIHMHIIMMPNPIEIHTQLRLESMNMRRHWIRVARCLLWVNYLNATNSLIASWIMRFLGLVMRLESTSGNILEWYHVLSDELALTPGCLLGLLVSFSAHYNRKNPKQELMNCFSQHNEEDIDMSIWIL